MSHAKLLATRMIGSKVRGSRNSSTSFLGKFCLNSQIFWKPFNNHNILVTNCEKKKKIVATVSRKTPNILDERNGYPEIFSLSQAFREISIKEMCRKKTLGCPVYTSPVRGGCRSLSGSINRYNLVGTLPCHNVYATENFAKKTTWRPLKLFRPYTESPSYCLKVGKLG